VNEVLLSQFPVTDAEREVADLLPIEAGPEVALSVRDSVPFWFHTFALNRAHGIYTPGAARDHRSRVPALPAEFEGQSVLDVGTFDGFYAFLAEHRGAARVVAIDNEQYRLWVAARWDIELQGGEGFQAIHRLLGSTVEYRHLDALEIDRLDEAFDFIYCFGILHRVEDPLGLLRALHERTVRGGTVLVETYGVPSKDRDGAEVRPLAPGQVYAGDSFVYWGFAQAGLAELARAAGFERSEAISDVEVDGHPRVLARLSA
jgi:tRNA (mo5U34)-methyltransferase